MPLMIMIFADTIIFDYRNRLHLRAIDAYST